MALINCPECNREISDKAKSCPSCGLPLENTISNAPPVVESIEMTPGPSMKTCPSCNSHNVQSIKMMCLNGTSSGRSTGIGVSSDLEVGVGSMSSNSQTALAEQFTPKISPDRVIKGCGCFFFVAGLLALFAFIQSSGDGAAIALCFGVPAVVIGFIVLKKFKNASPDQIKWEAKVKLYENGWICHKCGYTWIPSDVADLGKSVNGVFITNLINDTDNTSKYNGKKPNSLLATLNSNPQYWFIVAFIVFILLVVINSI